jgi:hypothetical protein
MPKCKEKDHVVFLMNSRETLPTYAIVSLNACNVVRKWRYSA